MKATDCQWVQDDQRTFLECWDGDERLFTIYWPEKMDRNQMLLDAFNAGRQVGEERGRSQLRWQLHALLDVNAAMDKP